MIKVLNNKLALLGFTSLCLMSAAQANSDGLVVFEVQPDGFSNVNAGSAPRTVSYVIQNLSDDPAPVYDLAINPLADDDFADVDGLFVILDTITAPAVPGALACGSVSFTLPPADSMDPNFCQIDVEIDPSAIVAEDDEIPTGLVDREFVVSLSTDQRELAASIEFGVTVGGSTESFSLVGNNICNVYPAVPGTDPVCTFDDVYAEDGMLQVDQDVASLGCTSADQAGGTPCLTHNITLNGNAAYFSDDEPAITVANDLQTAMNNIDALECTMVIPTDYFTSPQTVYPDEVYCFNYTGPTSPVVISDVITYRGSGKYVFKILTDPDGAYALDISPGAKFDLLNNACAGNIYWYVEGKTTIDVNTLFVGNILATDYIEAEDNVGAQGLIYGRLLSQADLALQGNAIIDPATLGGDCDCNCSE